MITDSATALDMTIREFFDEERAISIEIRHYLFVRIYNWLGEIFPEEDYRPKVRLIVVKTKRDLLDISLFGRKSVAAIEKMLATANLSLNMIGEIDPTG